MQGVKGSFSFGRKEKVNQIHQELELTIKKRDCLDFAWFVIVLMALRLVLSIVYFVLRWFIDFANDSGPTAEACVTDGIFAAAAAYGLFTGLTVKRAVSAMDKLKIRSASRLLFVLAVVMGVTCLAYGGVQQAANLEVFESYGMGLSHYVLVVMLVSSCVFCVFTSYYLKLVSITECIGNYYNINSHQGAVYRNPFSAL